MSSFILSSESTYQIRYITKNSLEKNNRQNYLFFFITYTPMT